MIARRRRAFLFGSCVSRDTFRYLPGDEYVVARYVARQSFASTVNPPGDVGLDLSVLPSAFQRRSVAAALHGDALEQLDAAAIVGVDIVLIDITDERLGLYQLPGGGLVTRSVELIAAGLDDQLAARSTILPFGSAEHLRWWVPGAEAVLGAIARHDLLGKTLVLAPPWATANASGGRTPSSFGITAEEFEGRQGPYLDVLADALGPSRIVGRGLSVKSSPAHVWGEAPFHYTDDTYLSIASMIMDSCRVHR